jgi:predicted helicase
MVAVQTYTFDQVLDTLPSEPTARGRAFEQLCQWYLTSSPEYRRQIKSVSKPSGRDIGIDLVAETHDGKRWAIQCKAYDSSYQIKKAEIDSFLSASASPEISFRLLISTTNKIGRNAEDTLSLQEKPVGRLLLSDLRRSQIDWLAWQNSQRRPLPEPKKPICIHFIPLIVVYRL